MLSWCDRSRISLRNARFFLQVVLLWVATLPSLAQEQHTLRPVTVADAIEMTRFAESAPGSSVATFSPDGTRFFVVISKGNLQNNTNEYSLLLFDVVAGVPSAKPKVLTTMSSSSNEPAIIGAKWLNDGETIAFIGERPGRPAEVFTLNIKTGLLRKRTQHPTRVRAFDINDDGSMIIYEADPADKCTLEEVRRDGIVVNGQSLKQIMAGQCSIFTPSFSGAGEEVFVEKNGKPLVSIAIEDLIIGGRNALSISPHGSYALVEVFVRSVPTSWAGYKNDLVHRFATEKRREGLSSRLTRYLLVELATGHVSPLLDGPMDPDGKGFAWNPNGQSIGLSGAYLSLDGVDEEERTKREQSPFVGELDLSTRQFTTITNQNIQLKRWDRLSDKIVLAPIDAEDEASDLAYVKGSEGWMKSSVPTVSKVPQVTVEEDNNRPPQLYTVDPKTQQKKLLLDINPQFSELQFGKVQQIRWKATDGHVVEGGLYLPPDYTPGKRYPLVIQTHGFSKSKFWIDGPFSSANAAQALVSKGFAVLQDGIVHLDPNESEKIEGTPHEAPFFVAGYEGAIDYLDSIGVIDRNRVGIVGFSRTVYYVEYALAFSKYNFAAATVADGLNGGYFSYAEFPNDEYEHINGGPPLGDGLSAWIRNSPGFNSDKVHTPLRMEYYGGDTGGVLGGWEWFSLLARQDKPVDMIYLPFGHHVLVKPWEKMTSEQGAVDWFSFWLKGEEDPDPKKSGQYQRWRHLKELHKQKQKKTA